MITQRIDNIAHIPKKSLVEVPPIPKSVKIEITGKCNYRCGYCAIMARKYAGFGTSMDFRLFKKIVAELHTLGVEEIGLFLIGESFTAPDLLVKCINHLKRNYEFPYVFLTSNASLAFHPVVYRCMTARLDSLKWSCNFYDKEQFKRITGVKETLFDDAVTNIRLAWKVRREYKLKTKLYASSIRYDDEQYEKMQGFLKENVLPYVDEHYWLPLYSMGSLATAKEKELGMKPIAGNPGRYENPVPPVPCWSVFTEGHILSDGRVTACCADATGEWVMGDMNTQTFAEVWESKEFKKLRKAHLNDKITGTKCEHCVIYK